MASSSELTRRKALKAMYSEVATNVRNGHGVAPLKNGGYRYNSMGLTKYDPSPSNNNQLAISNYSSYSQRMDMKLGKQFSNNAINGTENVKYESDTGNLIRVTYKQGTEYNAPLMATGDLNTEGGRLADASANDFVPYGETINYPGVIIDNDSSIFKTSGNGRCSEQCQSWVKNLTSIEHIGSDKWNRLNANEQMTGFSLTSPILLWSAYDIYITDAKDNYDLSGYIINGKHRGGILTNSFNPVLYFDPYDHINLNINVGVSRSININTIDTSLNDYRVRRDIRLSSIRGITGEYNSDISQGIIHWNPKERGVYYYNSVDDDPLIGGKIVIGNIDGGSKNTYSPTDLIIYPYIQMVGYGVEEESNDNTPSYTFNSNKSGTINISPSNYTITPTEAIKGDNTITFSTLSSGLYTGITITITEYDVSNVSNTLTINDFRILLDVDGPIITQITPIPQRTDNNTPSYVFNITEEGSITINSGTNSNLQFTINDTNYDGDKTNDVSGGNNTLKITSTDSKPLSDGTYSNISLYTTDVAGNNSSTLTIPSFTIDTIGPLVTNIIHISEFNNSQNPSFSFTSDESGVITISDVSFTPIDGNQSNIIETLPVTPQSISIGLNTITFDTLALGAYDISFTLTDDMDNSANYPLDTFTIDTLNPLINVISSPLPSSTNRNPTYDFSSNKNGTLTIIPYNYTISETNVNVGQNKITFQNLIPMTHSNISIFITDSAGNVSNILVIPSFTVGPLLAEVETPPQFTNNINPIYRLSSTLDGSINVYSAFFIPASNPTTSVNKSLPYTTTDSSNIYSADASATIQFDNLDPGVYKYIGVTVTDNSDNESRPLYIPNFTVDTTGPEISEQTPVPTTTNINPSYVFNSNEIGTITISDASFTATNNDTPIQQNIIVTPTDVIEGPNTITFTNLGLGKYSDISFKVIDRAGNLSNDISDISFDIVAEPQLTMITPIPESSSDLTPSFTFNTGLAGTIDIGVVNTKAVFDASEAYHNAKSFIDPVNNTIEKLDTAIKKTVESFDHITNLTSSQNSVLVNSLRNISYEGDPLDKIYEEVDLSYYNPNDNDNLNYLLNDFIRVDTIDYVDDYSYNGTNLTKKMIDFSNSIHNIIYNRNENQRYTDNILDNIEINYTNLLTYINKIDNDFNININAHSAKISIYAAELSNNSFDHYKTIATNFSDIANDANLNRSTVAGNTDISVNLADAVNEIVGAEQTLYVTTYYLWWPIVNGVLRDSGGTSIHNELTSYVNDVRTKNSNLVQTVLVGLSNDPFGNPSINFSDYSLTNFSQIQQFPQPTLTEKLDGKEPQRLSYSFSDFINPINENIGYINRELDDISTNYDHRLYLNEKKTKAASIMSKIKDLSNSDLSQNMNTVRDLLYGPYASTDSAFSNTNPYYSDFSSKAQEIDTTKDNYTNLADTIEYFKTTTVTDTSLISIHSDASNKLIDISSLVFGIKEKFEDWNNKYESIYGKSTFFLTDSDNFSVKNNIIITKEDISRLKDISNDISEMIELNNKIDTSRNEFTQLYNDLTQIDTKAKNLVAIYDSSYSGDITNYNTSIANIIDTKTVTTPGDHTITFDTLISDITYTDISFTLSSGDITSVKLEIVDFSIDAVPLFTYGPDIPSPSSNSTPTYIFNSKIKAGSIDRNPDFSYHITDTQGNKITTITADTSNTLTFTTLPIGTYSDISFIFTPTLSPNGNSVKLLIPQFIIDTAFVGLSNSYNIPVTVKPYYNHNTGTSNNNRYVFGGGEFEANKIYTLSTNSSAYKFTNIPLKHPMAILNNGNSYISASPASDYMEIVVSGGQLFTGTNGEYYTFKYNEEDIHFGRSSGENTFKFMRGGKYRFKADNISGHPFKIFVNNSQQGLAISNTDDNIEFTIPSDIVTSTAENFRYQCGNHLGMTNTLPFTDKTVSGTTSDGTYDFYYGDIDVTVTGDFGSVSVYCYYHGYMGGLNLLTYV